MVQNSKNLSFQAKSVWNQCRIRPSRWGSNRYINNTFSSFSLQRTLQKSHSISFSDEFVFFRRDKNPGEKIPKSLTTVLPVMAVIYVLVNISYLAVLTPQEIISTGMNVSRQRGTSHYYYLPSINMDSCAL